MRQFTPRSNKCKCYIKDNFDAFYLAKINYKEINDKSFYFKIVINYAFNFANNELFAFLKCNNYTIDNLLLFNPFPGTFPEK